LVEKEEKRDLLTDNADRECPGWNVGLGGGFVFFSGVILDEGRLNRQTGGRKSAQRLPIPKNEVGI